MRVLAKLNHPHVIKYLGSFQQGTVLNIITELAESGSLYDMVKNMALLFDLVQGGGQVSRLYMGEGGVLGPSSRLLRGSVTSVFRSTILPKKAKVLPGKVQRARQPEPVRYTPAFYRNCILV